MIGGVVATVGNVVEGPGMDRVLRTKRECLSYYNPKERITFVISKELS